jgi:hypothetical protein
MKDARTDSALMTELKTQNSELKGTPALSVTRKAGDEQGPENS